MMSVICFISNNNRESLPFVHKLIVDLRSIVLVDYLILSIDRRSSSNLQKMEVNDEKPKVRGRTKKMEESQSEESSSESSESDEGIRPRRVLPPVVCFLPINP